MDEVGLIDWLISWTNCVNYVSIIDSNLHILWASQWQWMFDIERLAYVCAPRSNFHYCNITGWCQKKAVAIVTKYMDKVKPVLFSWNVNVNSGVRLFSKWNFIKQIRYTYRSRKRAVSGKQTFSSLLNAKYIIEIWIWTFVCVSEITWLWDRGLVCDNIVFYKTRKMLSVFLG